MPKGIKGFQKGHKINIGRKFPKHVPWNKGKKTGVIPWNKGTKGICKAWNKGKKLPKLSIEQRKKLSEIHKANREKNHLWKGGITEINSKIRNSLEYRLWREAVFKRDNYQWVWGGKEHGKKLHADHIKPFADYPELRFAIDNGRTLCEECHKKTDSYLKRKH